MRIPDPLNSVAARAVGSVAILLISLSLTGCDQVQDLVNGEPNTSTPPDTSSPATTPATTTAQQPVATPTQSIPTLTPQQLLEEFRAIPPREVTDAALQRVADVPEVAALIVDLDMTGAAISPAALALLAKFPNLKTVNLSNVHPPGGGFAGFSPESTFTEIELNYSSIDDAGLASLAGVKSLQRISLSNSRGVTPAGMVALGELGQLIDLDLSQTRVNDQMAPILARLPLVRLNLSKTAITDASLPALAQIKTLKDLTLAYCQVTGRAYRASFLGAQFTRLSVAETSFGEDGLLAIKGMKTLEELNVYRSGIQPINSVKAVFASLPNLKILIVGSNLVTDAAVAPWFGKCRNLEELNISGHKALLTNEGLRGLITLKNLKHVDCMDTAVNAAGAAALKEKIPGVQVTTGDGQRL